MALHSWTLGKCNCTVICISCGERIVCMTFFLFLLLFLYFYTPRLQFTPSQKHLFIVSLYTQTLSGHLLFMRAWIHTYACTHNCTALYLSGLHKCWRGMLFSKAISWECFRTYFIQSFETCYSCVASLANPGFPGSLQVRCLQVLTNWICQVRPCKSLYICIAVLTHLANTKNVQG